MLRKAEKELLEIAAEQNAAIVDKGVETEHNIESPYEPKSETMLEYQCQFRLCNQ
jgi:hypothetical protein